MDVGKSRSRKGTASPLAGWSGSVCLYSPLHLLYNILRVKRRNILLIQMFSKKTHILIRLWVAGTDRNIHTLFDGDPM